MIQERTLQILENTFFLILQEKVTDLWDRLQDLMPLETFAPGLIIQQGVFLNFVISIFFSSQNIPKEVAIGNIRTGLDNTTR